MKGTLAIFVALSLGLAFDGCSREKYRLERLHHFHRVIDCGYGRSDGPSADEPNGSRYAGY